MTTPKENRKKKAQRCKKNKERKEAKSERSVRVEGGGGRERWGSSEDGRTKDEGCEVKKLLRDE